MRHLELTEGAPPVAVNLSAAEAEGVAQLELAVVTRTGAPDVWEVAASSKIGVVRCGDLQVTVKPKVPIDRLLFLMGYARSPSFWRDPTVQLDPEQDLFSAVADAFARQAVKALGQGLLHGYRTVDDTLPVLRGRVRESEQIGRRFGLLIPLEVRYDEFTVDIAENQILLAAVVRLLRLPGISQQARRALQRLRLQLGDVSPLPRGALLPRWQPSRLNTRYQSALRFAELILAATSYEQRVGLLPVTGFVFDMWRIFEDFVCVALGEAMAPSGGTSRTQESLHLDEDERVDMAPDFVWVDRRRIRVAADAKYKVQRPSGFPNADLYQMLAYCTVLGLDDGHLVYAKGADVERSYRVVGSPVTIHCHTLDLAAPPQGLLDQVGRLAERLAPQAAGT
jgi:5-methylcytosine-specific restriction enzyme subunit McrC